MDPFDTLIVGAGPAGCRAAYRLARAGARVAILDGSHPREKPCGGGVTGRTLDLVRDAIDGDHLPSVAVDAATFAFGDRVAAVPLRDSRFSRRLVVVSRRVFDAALLEAAVAAGAVLIPSRVTSVTRAGTGWTLATKAGDVAGTWLLGADGVNSLVRRRVATPFARRDLSIATGYFVHGATSREAAIAFEVKPAGYLWSFPRPDHLAVGICAQADASSPAALLPVLASWIEVWRIGQGDGRRLERYSWPIPSLSEASLLRERASGAHWLLLGDAAGLVDPLTREGIYFAIASGDLAAEALIEGRDPAAAYARRAEAGIKAELIRAARLKARFYRPPFMGLLVRALQRSGGIRATMADLVAGRQPYHGLRRRLLGTLEWRLMLELLAQKI